MYWAANWDLHVEGYTCALQRDILYQGKMFVSENWICFHSKVFGRDTKVGSPPQLRLRSGPVPVVTCRCLRITRFPSPWTLWPSLKKPKLRCWCPTPSWSEWQAVRYRSFPTFHGKENEFYLFLLSFSTCLYPSCLETQPTNFWSQSVFIWRYFTKSWFYILVALLWYLALQIW